MTVCRHFIFGLCGYIYVCISLYLYKYVRWFKHVYMYIIALFALTILHEYTSIIFWLWLILSDFAIGWFLFGFKLFALTLDAFALMALIDLLWICGVILLCKTYAICFLNICETIPQYLTTFFRQNKLISAII